MTDPVPPRRRFQFRLRTLMIVVTIAGIMCAASVWLKRQVDIVKERKALFYSAAPRRSLSGSVIRSLTADTDDPPLVRRWLGDKAYSRIVLDDSATVEEIRRYRAAYQEAEVVRFSDAK